MRHAKTKKEKVAEQIVPEINPLGLGGLGPMENMMPLAIIGGANRVSPTTGSMSPSMATPNQSPMPARTESTSLTTPKPGSRGVDFGGGPLATSGSGGEGRSGSAKFFVGMSQIKNGIQLDCIHPQAQGVCEDSCL